MARKDSISIVKKSVLSPLEGEILELLWKAPSEARVKDIHSRLKAKAAQTSVAVMLDRLYEKRLVSRKTQQGRGGLYYLYSPRVTKEEFNNSVLAASVDSLLAQFGPSAVNYFNERFNKK